MLMLLLLLYLHNLYSFLKKIILSSFNSSVASNKCCVFCPRFSLLHNLFVCLFVTKHIIIIIIIIINIIISRHELGLDGSASISSNSLFKRLHKSFSSIWPTIQLYFWYSGVVNSCYVLTDLIISACSLISEPGSSVGIATDYGLDGPGSNPGGDKIFLPSRPAL